MKIRIISVIKSYTTKIISSYSHINQHWSWGCYISWHHMIFGVMTSKRFLVHQPVIPQVLSNTIWVSTFRYSLVSGWPGISGIITQLQYQQFLLLYKSSAKFCECAWLKKALAPNMDIHLPLIHESWSSKQNHGLLVGGPNEIICEWDGPIYLLSKIGLFWCFGWINLWHIFTNFQSWTPLGICRFVVLLSFKQSCAQKRVKHGSFQDTLQAYEY